MKKTHGFTLIELMVVLAIIAILSLLALPSPDPGIVRKQVTESMELIEDYKKLVTFYQKTTLAFLKDNKEAGMPAPELIIGNYIDRVELEKGAIHLHFGNKAHPRIKGKYLSIRPVVVKKSPQSPISWVCGMAKIPEGMQAVGENKTDVEVAVLPFICRI